MATGSSKSVPPSQVPDSVKSDVEQIVQSGMADFTLRQLLGFLISSTSEAERQVYLEKAEQDVSNGYYHRNLQLGSMPVEVRVPRTRSGEFRPTTLPSPYRRGYSEEVESILLSLLSSSRSINAAKDALQKMGLSHSAEDMERIAANLIEELELHNSGPLDPDLLGLFFDAKYVELREGGKLHEACIYVVVGLGRDGKKRILACIVRAGRESLEGWKAVLRGLLERGLRRVMMILHDDFSGLLHLTEGLFPNADVQLCTVHMQRNAKTHLSKTDALEFHQRWTSIKSSWTVELANAQFEELCDRFAKSYPSWIAELRKKRNHYLAFLKYPESVRRSFSSTNLVEAINGQLEIMRRNSGGYFHSEDTLKLKLGLAISSLEGGTWKTPAKMFFPVLHQLNAMFECRFEGAV